MLVKVSPQRNSFAKVAVIEDFWLYFEYWITLIKILLLVFVLLFPFPLSFTAKESTNSPFLDSNPQNALPDPINPGI